MPPHTGRYHVSVPRERTQQLGGPANYGGSTPTPGVWGELPSDQEGRPNRPATPRMSGAMPADRNDDAWGAATPTGRGAWNGGNYSKPVVEGSVHGQSEDEERAATNRRWLNREDAVVGNSEAEASTDWDETWEQCGLSGNKTARKTAHNVTAHGHDNNDTWGKPGPSQDIRTHTDQRPVVVGGDSRGSGTWGLGTQNNSGYSMAPQSSINQRYGTKAHGASPPGASHARLGRGLNPHINPDNYDGNRAGPDGSRVFYSAILPSVPTLGDIANHAEYTAWVDMLRSILKYHQLTAVIAPDANRPHGYKESRRWDQDRLRAAIIIKGALSFEVFERVRRNGWRDTEDPAETVEKVRETHGAACPCGHSQGMTLLDY